MADRTQADRITLGVVRAVRRAAPAARARRVPAWRSPRVDWITLDLGVSYTYGGRDQLMISGMITPDSRRMKRVTMTLDPVDVDLLDRLGVLEGRNRSEELRSILEQCRPMLAATVSAFEAARDQRDAFDLAAQELAVYGLLEALPEIEKLSQQYLGAMARIEGAGAAAAAAAESAGTEKPPSSNTGVTPPTPTTPEDEN